MDLNKEQTEVARIKRPPPIVLSGDHNLFNPVIWKRMTNGGLKRFTKIGADALEITAIRPLYTILAYDRVAATGFYIAVQQHADLTKPPKKSMEYVKLREKSTKSGLFTVIGTKGANNEDPDELTLELDNKQQVTITKQKPYQVIDG